MSKPKLIDYIHPDDPLFKALDKSLDGIYIGAHQPVADIITHVLAERDGAALRELRVARQMLRDADERSCRETDGLCSSPWCNGNHHDSACEGDYMTRRVLEGIDELLARQPQETPAPTAVVHLASKMHPEDTACGLQYAPEVKRTRRADNATCQQCLDFDAMCKATSREDADPAPAAATAPAPTAGVTEATIEEWVLHAFTTKGETSHYKLVTTAKLARGAEIMRTLLAERDAARAERDALKAENERLRDLTARSALPMDIDNGDRIIVDAVGGGWPPDHVYLRRLNADRSTIDLVRFVRPASLQPAPAAENPAAAPEHRQIDAAGCTLLNLYHIQDSDRPAHVLARSYGDAARVWESHIRDENEIADGDPIDPPDGITFVAQGGKHYPEIMVDVEALERERKGGGDGS